eukprot:CAMPEP_0185747234 /NCGR_PEP_ID=MMETSP1174-20130828/5836_1 /TAXON_ID=35687 /ORGANISM="Dictyocha speculum, Strain CCMP1381" /LENGTH=292 /DNA_ID=CAMNT_0028422301 /DNA_START=334 /DNA_END=1212 /DNA_ORIENTATION=+
MGYGGVAEEKNSHSQQADVNMTRSSLNDRKDQHRAQVKGDQSPKVTPKVSHNIRNSGSIQRASLSTISENTQDYKREYKSLPNLGTSHTFADNLGSKFLGFEARPRPPPSPLEAYDIATKRYLALRKRTSRGEVTWNDLTSKDVAVMQVVVKVWKQAAVQGHRKASFNLGVVYANGEGLERDDIEAARWYEMAAEQGDASAQYNLGNMYRKGRGVDKNLEVALHWYRKAADQGHRSAKFNIIRLQEDVFEQRSVRSSSSMSLINGGGSELEFGGTSAGDDAYEWRMLMESMK